MSAIPSAEVVMERLRMALAEAGYPDVPMRAEGSLSNGWPDIRHFSRDSVPPAVGWTAADIAYEGHYSCWPCAKRQSSALECVDGNCAHPNDPARPSRSELVSR